MAVHDRPSRDVVTVPDVVGMLFDAGRDEAHKAGVKLANPDPDGPPIAALAWPGPFFIQSQRPAPGTRVRRWDSVPIWLATDLQSDTAIADAPMPPSLLRAEADAPDPRTFPEPGIDLSSSPTG